MSFTDKDDFELNETDSFYADIPDDILMDYMRKKSVDWEQREVTLYILDKIISAAQAEVKRRIKVRLMKIATANEVKVVSEESIRLALKHASELMKQEKEEKDMVANKKKRSRRRKKKANSACALQARSTETDDEDSDDQGNNLDVTGESDSDTLDQSSAFVLTALNKCKKSLPPVRSTNKNKKKAQNALKRKQNAAFNKAREFSELAEDCAKSRNYRKAIDCYEQAIQFVPDNYKLYSDRSVCYYNIKKYREAFRDADTAVRLESTVTENHFRRGKALQQLHHYKDAVRAFERVLELDKFCVRARDEIMETWILQLTVFGFPDHLARAAVRKCNSLEAAIDELILSGINASAQENGEDSPLDEIYYSDDELEEGSHQRETVCETQFKSNGQEQPKASSSVQSRPKLNKQGKNGLQTDTTKEDGAKQKKNEEYKLGAVSRNSVKPNLDQPFSRNVYRPKFTAPRFHKVDPSNPKGYLSLWIGNVSPITTEKQLEDLFSKYGAIAGVKLIPEKYCAFVNYKGKSSAGVAINELQGTVLNGQTLLVQYPLSATHAPNGRRK